MIRGLGSLSALLVVCFACSFPVCAPVSAAGTNLGAAQPYKTAATSAFGVHLVHIEGTTYVAGDIGRIGGYVTRTSAVKYVLKLASLCKNAKAYFFASTKGGGVVAWLPTSLSGCFGVIGGGASTSPCAQEFRTPADQDPTRAVSPGGVAAPTYHVFIAGTSELACRDLSTQVPGGIWARTKVAFAGLPAGSALLIKCQMQTPQGLVDNLAPQTALPRSKSEWFVSDSYVTGGFLFAGVPSCSGANF